MIPQRVSDPKDLVRASSPLAIEDGLRAVAKRARRWNRWLTKNHPYNGDIISTLRQGTDIDGPKLSEYIAASAPLHLIDGWNYLSRAFDAVSRGDRSSAYHLAYYAELRAAISLLAAEGIGIFNDRHIALNDHLEPTEFKKTRRLTTHRATWLLLSDWSKETGRATRLLQGITVESKSLSEWLEAVGVVAPAQQLVAKEWLSAWSVDLDILSTDPSRRNEMSYRPTRIRIPAPLSIDPRLELAKPISDSWGELDPETGGVRAALDLSLLRQALMLVVKIGLCNYPSFDQALGSLKPKMRGLTYEALGTESESAVAIFRAAKIRDFQGKAATPILARGLLMLRLASASTASLFEAAEVSKSDLEFWWSALGSDLGLWETPADIETFSDLWIDVAEARDDADERMSSIQGEGSVQVVGGIIAQYVPLTQFSRAPMWLLGLD